MSTANKILRPMGTIMCIERCFFVAVNKGEEKANEQNIQRKRVLTEKNSKSKTDKASGLKWRDLGGIKKEWIPGSEKWAEQR